MANDNNLWGLSMRTDGRYGRLSGLGTRIAYENNCVCAGQRLVPLAQNTDVVRREQVVLAM